MGKEYDGLDDNELIFEGEYLNGKKWNGKGKEYYLDGDLSSHLKFEGEYINGEHGKNLHNKNL